MFLKLSCYPIMVPSQWSLLYPRIPDIDLFPVINFIIWCRIDGVIPANFPAKFMFGVVLFSNEVELLE